MPDITPNIRKQVQAFDFETLFLEELGWDTNRTNHAVSVNNQIFNLKAIAQKRGMVSLLCPTIPEYSLRIKIEKEVAKSYRENLIVYANPEKTQQVWQWVRHELHQPIRNRERIYREGQSGQIVAQPLAELKTELDEEDTLTIVDVTSRVRAAFDVEHVTKRFYDRFKREHDTFLEFINGVPDKDLHRWYASIMLNRLMFIYFIQKKGFLDGDLNYLRNKLEHVEGNFYRTFLLPLFFDGFATKKHSLDTQKLLGDIPYLNGGLFLMHQIEERYGEKIQIENTAFERLFTFFDSYSWNLDERPLKNDNEINPDVLGYIFEKYINQKQMGAYYTKEDITEYISKNTVIPHLFDAAQKEDKTAFEGEYSIWDLLLELPDRYMYPAVAHGTQLPLPNSIEAGIYDVVKRDGWNVSAPTNYALPTEIWREVVSRRQRHTEVRQKLINGEIRSINDLIAYNLDIQQFAQDVIETTDSADLLRAFWRAIKTTTILDPTCGSGAFLFAALNVLEPLYEACLIRMEGFISDYDRSGNINSQKYSDFRNVLKQIEQHPNRGYFILKSIIVNNLFGVDIMEEAVEICKLRLFLKLVSQVDERENLEPLPDIDFNIRTGNTLVGFVTQDDIHKALTTTTSGQRKFLFGEDIERLNIIERKAVDIDRLSRLFRQQQTELGGEVTGKDKAALKDKLKELENELNLLLAAQYGVNTVKIPDYQEWLQSYKPFHWFIEFYGTLKDGGFCVIIGNPPYVEYRTVRNDYTLNENVYRSIEANNLYAYCMERVTHLVAQNTWFGMIVPTSVIGLDKTETLRQVLFEKFQYHYCSTYGIRPSKLFDGVDQRLCIYLANVNSQKSLQIHSSRHHFWYTEERAHLFHCMELNSSFNFERLMRVPQISQSYAAQIIKKLDQKGTKTIQDYFSSSTNSAVMHYHRSPRYWIRSIDFEPHFRSETRNRSIHHFRDLYFRSKQDSKIIGALLNSSLFFFWFVSVGNGRNITGSDINQFPIGELTDGILNQLPPVFDRLMEDYKRNSVLRVRSDSEFQEFHQSKSKQIMDEIDIIFARHYGLTPEELDFILNFEIKYRMGIGASSGEKDTDGGDE